MTQAIRGILAGAFALAALLTLLSAIGPAPAAARASATAEQHETATLEEQEADDKRDKRITISAIFVSILVGLAYAEMFAKVRDSLHDNGVRIEDVLLFVAFFLTGMRFFIGNQIHLIGLSDPRVVGDTLVHASGWVWIYDFLWISGQGVVLALLGSVTSLDASRGAKVDFYKFLVLLYAVDIAWIASRGVLHQTLEPWASLEAPTWSWAVLNGIFVVVLLAIMRTSRDRLGRGPLWVLSGASVVAFVVDVIMVDNARLL